MVNYLSTLLFILLTSKCFCVEPAEFDHAKCTADDVAFLLRLETCVHDLEDSWKRSSENVYKNLVFIKNEIEGHQGQSLNIQAAILEVSKKISEYKVQLNKKDINTLNEKVAKTISKHKKHAKYVAYIMHDKGYEFNEEEEELLFPSAGLNVDLNAPDKTTHELHQAVIYATSGILIRDIPLTIGAVWGNRITDMGVISAVMYLRQRNNEAKKR